MRKSENILLILALMGLLLLPLLQGIRPTFPETKLYGSVKPLRLTKPNLENWLNASWQKNTEKWLERRLGFRAGMIKTDNQIRFNVFGEASRVSADNTPVVVGKGNWLYEEFYIEDYLRPRHYPVEETQRVTRAIKKLQEALEAHGVAFTVLISPNKAAVHPEKIPERYLKYKSAMDAPSSYREMLELFEQQDVNYVDGDAFLKTVVGQAAYPLFPRSGSHWSNYGAWLVLEEVIKALNPAMQNSFPECRLGEVTMGDPKGVDQDLAGLINVWTKKSFYSPVPTFHLDYDESDRPRPKPKVFMVGTSFADHITKLCDENDLVEEFALSGYFQGINQQIGSNFDATKLSLKDLYDLLVSRDAVILESNVTYLPDIGWNFPEQAVEALSTFGKKDL